MKSLPIQRVLRSPALATAGAFASIFLGSPLAWAQTPEAPDFGQIVSFIRWGGVFFSFFVVIGTAIVLRVIREIATRLGNRFTSQRLLIQKIESFTQFALYLSAASICIGISIRLDATAMALIGGALAFSVGFATRDLVAAFMAGITIMFDRPFQVGDRVNYAGEYGDIIKIGLRSVRMNTLDDNVVTIPNNKILTDVTSCGNYGELEMQVAIDFYVGADQDVELASRLILEACLTSRFCYLDRSVSISAKQVIFDHYLAFHIKARPYVLDVKYEKAFETDIHLRVQKVFAQKKILAPAIIHRSV